MLQFCLGNYSDQFPNLASEYVFTCNSVVAIPWMCSCVNFLEWL